MGSRRSADRSLRHSIEELFPAAGAGFGDGVGPFYEVGFNIGVRLRTDEGEAAHALRNTAPKLQHDVTSDGAADEYCFAKRQIIEQTDDVQGQLRHGQRGRIGHSRTAADRQTGSQFRGAVSAQIGNNGTHVAEAVDCGKPIKVIEWGGMKKDNRNAFSIVEILETRSRGKVELAIHRETSAFCLQRRRSSIHTSLCAGWVRARSTDRLFRDAYPSG